MHTRISCEHVIVNTACCCHKNRYKGKVAFWGYYLLQMNGVIVFTGNAQSFWGTSSSVGGRLQRCHSFQAQLLNKSYSSGISWSTLIMHRQNTIATAVRVRGCSGVSRFAFVLSLNLWIMETRAVKADLIQSFPP